MTTARVPSVVPATEACRLLGIEERRLKQLVRDHVLSVAEDEAGTRGIPTEMIVKGQNGWVPLPDLQGTLTLLSDDGFTADELGERPIDALVAGRHRRVNRIASALAF